MSRTACLHPLKASKIGIRGRNENRRRTGNQSLHSCYESNYKTHGTKRDGFFTEALIVILELRVDNAINCVN